VCSKKDCARKEVKRVSEEEICFVLNFENRKIWFGQLERSYGRKTKAFQDGDALIKEWNEG